MLKKYQQLTITCMLIINMKWFCWVINIGNLRRCIPHENTKERVISFCIILCLHAFLYCVDYYHDNNVAVAKWIIER